MDNLRHKISIIFIVFFLVFASQVSAEEFACWLSAPDQHDIWVIVYQASEDGDRGSIIWEGKISAGEKIQIKCNTGHIRYNYAKEEGQPYEGDLSRWCGENEDIQLP